MVYCELHNSIAYSLLKLKFIFLAISISIYTLYI